MTLLTPSKEDLARLHDAVIVDFQLRWENGLLVIAVRDAMGPLRIVAEGVTRLECPREQPWGPSSSLNEVHVNRSSATTVRLEMQMQSGDSVIVWAQSVTLVR